MARPRRIQYPGASYYVTSRGNERKEIFVDSVDQRIFLEKLSASLEIYLASLKTVPCYENVADAFNVARTRVSP